MDQEDTSLYKTLGINPAQVDVLTLSERQITRHYRKAALKWHPDKNANNPSAAAKFSQIFVAYETLTSPTQRKRYDNAIRAVRDRKRRFQALDEDRRRLKEDLVRREEAVGVKTEVNLDREALERMQREIERLRREVLRDEPRSVGKSEREGGVWAQVEGYAEFRGGKGGFEEFEEAVLSGRFPE